MYIRALSIALWCAYATAALTPLSAAGDDNECALYLSGPGRTSAYDYSLNLLKGNFGYEGQHTCITYDAVNQAYLEARNRIVVSQPKGDWKAEDFASVGELILDISINLARTYGLTYEEIEKGLPLIDTSRTLIREVCPPVFSHVECRAGKYRRLDGLCNNLQHPTWGATMAPFQRLIGPLFADGINAPRISHTGHDLPLSRVVSRTMHPDDGFHDHAGTVMVIAWGQFMDHDFTLTGTPLDPINRNDPEECCKRPPHLKHPYCNEIRVPEDDYFYRLFNVKCIDFVRGFPSPRPGCRLGSRVPFNTLTGAIDGNTVYGVTEKFARKLRTGYGGLLRMNPVFKEYGLRDLLPLKLDIPDEGCTRPNKNMYCFEAGEIRVNEQLVLTVMHTLMAREHNRIANALAEVNPHWDDETLFQEARRINIAEIQHITYNEFLPILLGKDVMEKFGLLLEKEGYWNGYDSEVNPDVLDSFAAAAYRFGHSLLPTAVERWSKAHKFIASKRLSDLIRRPYDLYRAGVLDEYVMGLMNQVAQAMDDSITQEVTNHLFKKVGARFGMDLVSFNMQRGREFGLPGYMEFRKFCGLPGAESFQDLFGTMSNETVRKYETIFEHPIDVDLWSGGVSERPLPGSMLGPTFACVIATQFSYSRRGDRFWYELPNQPSTFTPEQLTEIRKARLARVICDNTDIIDTVQLYPMVLPDHELNPRVPCRSGIIPSIDFTKWAEPVPFHGPAKQFMTDAQAINEHENTASTTLPTTIKNTTNEKSFSSEKDSNCNTSHDFQPTLKPSVATLDTSTNLTSNNQNNNTSQNDIFDCTKDSGTNDCLTKLSLSDESHNSDTVLKYVYKANDKTDISEKSIPHSLNNLRKKRSIVDDGKVENITVNENKNSPLIVDYETIHSPVKSIKNAALADFNIETVHETKSLPLKNDKHSNEHFSEENNEKRYSDESVERSNNDKNKESDENDNNSRAYDRNNASYRNNEHSSREEYKTKLRDNSRENSQSKEKDEHYRRDDRYLPRNNRRKYDDERDYYSPRVAHLKPHSGESHEINDKYSEQPVKRNEESRENNESPDSKEHNKSSYRDDSKETNIKQKYQNDKLRYSDETTEKNNSNESPNNDNIVKPVIDVSNENDEDYKNEEKSKNENKYSDDLTKSNNTAPSFQEVDIGDFSFERIQVNDKGQIETAKESDDYDTTRPITEDQKSKTHASQVKESSASLENSYESLSDSENQKEPIHINDGEIKPVVEINSENHDSDEDHSKEDKKSDSEENTSLETLLGTDEKRTNYDNNKIIQQKNDDETNDVKQQFERIPANYSHDNKNENNKDAQNNDKIDESISHNEGTVDATTPSNENFDEHLKFKFDDINIKLPEIKLPEDVLAYTNENPADEKNNDEEKDNDNFYQYSDEIYPEARNNKPKVDDNTEEDDDENDDRGYYGYYGDNNEKEKYQKKENDEEEEEESHGEDEDLYEKFVRERFGKTGSFQKRSEKLQDASIRPRDEKLYDTLKNIMKQTQEIQKQAENSGDPKAGYMWTLEYGENL